MADLIGDEVAAWWDSYALWATGILEDDVLTQAQAIMREGLQQGLTPAELISRLDTVLGDYLPEYDAAGGLVNIPLRLETIARTNTGEAIEAGRLAAFSDPDLEGFLVGLQYSAVLDNRVRENHAAWDQVVRTPDFWDAKGVPPSGFNCRCSLYPVSIYDNIEPTLDADLPSERIPDEGFVGRGGAMEGTQSSE